MKTTNAARSTKRTKAGRGDRRREKAQARDLLAALDALSLFASDGAWAATATRIMPLLRRVHQPFMVGAQPLEMLVPPGVWTGFGMDLGPAWGHVSRELVERWGVDDTVLLGTALENLRRKAVEQPPRVDTARFAGAAATVIQAEGWGSSLILAPDRLADLIGDEPRTLMVPVRNALVVLPSEVDTELAVAIWDAFTHHAQDELDVEPLRWTGSMVVGLEEPLGGLLH